MGIGHLHAHSDAATQPLQMRISPSAEEQDNACRIHQTQYQQSAYVLAVVVDAGGQHVGIKL